MGVTGPKLQRIPMGFVGPHHGFCTTDEEVIEFRRNLLRRMPFHHFMLAGRDKTWQEVYDERTLLRPATPGPVKNTDLLLPTG